MCPLLRNGEDILEGYPRGSSDPQKQDGSGDKDISSRQQAACSSRSFSR